MSTIFQINSSPRKVFHTEQRSDEETPYIDNEYENVSTSSYFYETDDDISEATSVKSNLDKYECIKEDLAVGQYATSYQISYERAF
ncbi:hypothetical protein CVS40_11098 [Lucilia cuprina]|nr:hypothetical protein CVS40_11098 [Lucilia cuprina]